jgi:hypothetical protein
VMLIVMNLSLLATCFTHFLEATEMAISQRLSDVLSHTALYLYCPPSPHHGQVTTRSSGLTFVHLFNIFYASPVISFIIYEICNVCQGRATRLL